jgi:rhomboid protease GluP
MEFANRPSVVVFRSLHQRYCGEQGVVLESAGIASEVIRRDGAWELIVDEQDQDAALSELEAYRQEKTSEPKTDTVPIPMLGGAMVGIVFYAAITISVFVLDDISAYGLDWSESGHMRAGDVMTGQVWRTITAMTLHADLVHLLSNLLFGSLFGFLVGRILGGGVAWLAIVAAGAVGNALNAFFRDPDHTSIGASTAVFASLGMLVAHALKPRSQVHQPLLKRWSPLIGGVLLLAFIGVGGERTDVGAHVTGWLAGLAIGFAACRLPDRHLSSPWIQTFASILAMLLIIASWITAGLAS